MKQEEKQYLIEQANNPDIKDISEVSDGYHTFNSLYNQRLCLWAALIKAYKDLAWKTKYHNDGEPCFGGGWFLVGITTPAGDYTYHYELKHWDLFDCKVLDKAPEFDGHTDKDVTRVLTLQPRYTSQWIPVEERLPEENTAPLVRMDLTDKFGEETILYDVVVFDGNGFHATYKITHWMEIVPPRKED